MRTPLALQITCLLFALTVVAEDKLVLKSEPMLLSYYTPQRQLNLMADTAERPRVTKLESKLPPSSWKASMPQNFNLVSFTQVRLGENMEAGPQTLSSTRKPLTPRTNMVRQEKFSFNNLMEGSLYDFRKANGMRLEVGPPMAEETETFNSGKYEEPFCVTFWLRFKI